MKASVSSTSPDGKNILVRPPASTAKQSSQLLDAVEDPTSSRVDHMICMCSCVHACTYLLIYLPMYLSDYLAACGCVYVCVSMHACMHACMYVCVCGCVGVHVCTHARIHVCACACVVSSCMSCILICMYILVHTHAYISLAFTNPRDALWA